MDAEQGTVSPVSSLLATLAVATAVLGPLSSGSYWLLWLPAVPVVLLVLEWRTTPGVVHKPHRRHLLPIFPIANGVVSVACQSSFGFAAWQTTLMYAAFVVAAVIVMWQFLKFNGLVTGSHRRRIDIS